MLWSVDVAVIWCKEWNEYVPSCIIVKSCMMRQGFISHAYMIWEGLCCVSRRGKTWDRDGARPICSLLWLPSLDLPPFNVELYPQNWIMTNVWHFMPWCGVCKAIFETEISWLRTAGITARIQASTFNHHHSKSKFKSQPSRPRPHSKKGISALIVT